MSWLNLAKTYDNINTFIRPVVKRNLRGRGYLLRKVKSDHIFMLHGNKMFFNHEVAGCYVGLINGKYTEPETHLFLRMIIEDLDAEVNFVDVGANIGEFILDLASYEKVKHIFAFEPHPECARTCGINVSINGLDNKVHVIQKILSEDTAPVNFYFNSISPNASGITDKNMILESMQYPSTLDIEIGESTLPTILLIDVEGYEPLVLKGGKHFISTNKPLIVFEFNETSKKIYNLNDIKHILGNQYEIYRLRNDAYLDSQFNDTWNCVAVNLFSLFYPSVQSRLM